MLRSDPGTSITTRKNIIIFVLLNFAIYVALFMIFRTLNLLHLSGLRMVNYVTLGIISCIQIDRWVKSGGEFVPFLKAFLRAFITGTLSFILFAIFIFLYSKTDPYFSGLYFNDSDGTISLTPFIIIFFEGSAGSLIVGLIAAMYSEKYKAKQEYFPKRGV